MSKENHNKTLKDELNEKIDATLERWSNDEDNISDGYNILRWARKGLLTRKPEPKVTPDQEDDLFGYY